MGIGDIIHARRKELGLTLEQVGDVVGVTKNTVRQWENGNISNMRRDKIAKLAEALRIDPINLIGEDGTDDVERNYLRICGMPLVQAYRDAPEYIQKAICQMLQIFDLHDLTHQLLADLAVCLCVLLKQFFQIADHRLLSDFIAFSRIILIFDIRERCNFGVQISG